MAPVVATLVLEGGRVGDELGGMALLELGSALAAVTSSDAGSDAGAPTPATDGADEAASHLEPGRLGRAPRWIDDTPPLARSGGTASSSRHIATVVPGVRFPSLEALRAAVRRCALTRAALVPVAVGSPAEVAAALGASRAAACAAQVLAPGRKGVSRPALEAVGASLWDAGVGRAIAANRAWLERLAKSESAPVDADGRKRDARDETTTTKAKETPNEPPVLPHYYVYPEGILGEVAAWGADSRTRLRAIDAPNAMPPEQATLAANAARVKPGDFVLDPCVGGGAVAFAAAALGATRVLGCDVDESALDAAREAATRFFQTETKGGSSFDVKVAFAKASLLEDPRFSEAYGGLENAVDAIVTDLPYGVRSAAAGRWPTGDGFGKEEEATPASMLDALLVLARRALKKNGRVAVWLRRVVPEETALTNTNTNTNRRGGVGGMSEEVVAATCASFGFRVERRAAETRKSGVQRALYVLTRDDFRETYEETDEEIDERAARRLARSERDAADAAAHEARAAALVMHCRLRRNENHGRVAASGGQDIWRAAWTGDVASARRLLSFASSDADDADRDEDEDVASRFLDGEKKTETETETETENETVLRLRSGPGSGSGSRSALVLNAREPAGARNTPLTCAAMYGRGAVVDALLDLGAEVEKNGSVDVGVSDARRRTATHRAAERGAAETVAALLRRGGDPFAVRPVSANGGTAFHAAAERGHLQVFRLLLDFCRERDERDGSEKNAPASRLASALAGEDDSGRTPALAAARRGHADVVAAALEALEETVGRVTNADGSDGDTPPDTDGSPAGAGAGAGAKKKASRATENAAVSAAAEAARWGHVLAVRAAASFVDFSSASRRGRDALTRLAFEAERWQRDDVRAFVEELRARASSSDAARAAPKREAAATERRAPGGKKKAPKDDVVPAVPAGASAVRADARSGAALFYARDFFRDPPLVASMLAAFEAAYLHRDHPLVTPADRRGERRPVPRDQAYYAARYVSREDAASPANDKNKRVWYASYRYNPDRTQQPTPSSDPPKGLLALAAKVARATGQTCNHAVINRYENGDDAIGAHADKDLDLEDGSFVVSVSFGAERVMTFRPRRNLDDADADADAGGHPSAETDVETLDVSSTALRRPGPETVKSTRRALLRLLRADPEWRAASEAKARAPPRSDAKRAAAAREKARAAALRVDDPAVIAAAAEAEAARRAWREYRDKNAFRVALEHGSAVFFNMAFNARWTHAIDAASSTGHAEGDVSVEDEDEDSDEDEDEDETAEAARKKMREFEKGKASRADAGARVGERVGVTLRRSRVAFDPALCAAPDLPRARRRDAWRDLREGMADVDAAETRWREG